MATMSGYFEQHGEQAFIAKAILTGGFLRPGPFTYPDPGL
jgi:hypothetical protein